MDVKENDDSLIRISLYSIVSLESTRMCCLSGIGNRLADSYNIETIVRLYSHHAGHPFQVTFSNNRDILQKCKSKCII
jgi:hypothetical protein